MKLDFSSEKKIKKKKTRAFIISFSAFVLVLGTISLLMFMKSINFDFKNLMPDTSEKTTEAESQTKAPNQSVSGSANIIIVCTDSKNNLFSLSFINCNMDNMKIRLLQLPTDEAVEVDGSMQTFNDICSKNGNDALKKAVSTFTGLTVDKIIKVKDTELKKIVAQTGDVTVDIPNSVDYKSDDFSLLLDAGSQSLTSDMFCKYLKYCDTEQKGTAFTSYLNTLLSVENIPSQDKLFNFLVNNSTTDISIVDYTNVSAAITDYIQRKTDASVLKISDKTQLIEVTNEN